MRNIAVLSLFFSAICALRCFNGTEFRFGDPEDNGQVALIDCPPEATCCKFTRSRVGEHYKCSSDYQGERPKCSPPRILDSRWCFCPSFDHPKCMGATANRLMNGNQGEEEE